jgi:hypothetical protein
MRRNTGLIIVALFVASSAAHAQRPRTEYGVAVEYRRQIGELEESLDRRKGLSIRIQADIPWNRHLGWRVEGSYAQVQYDRSDPLGVTPINETNLELGGFVRAFHNRNARLSPYLLAGPLATLRASCDVDNAFGMSDLTECGGGEDFLFGWGAGVGLRLANWIGGWGWFIESRLLGNVTSAAGGRMVTISLGAGM